MALEPEVRSGGDPSPLIGYRKVHRPCNNSINMEDAEFAEEMQISAASAFSMFLVRFRSNMSRHLIDHPAYALVEQYLVKVDEKSNR